MSYLFAQTFKINVLSHKRFIEFNFKNGIKNAGRIIKFYKLLQKITFVAFSAAWKTKLKLSFVFIFINICCLIRCSVNFFNREHVLHVDRNLYQSFNKVSSNLDLLNEGFLEIIKSLIHVLVFLNDTINIFKFVLIKFHYFEFLICLLYFYQSS